MNVVAPGFVETSMTEQIGGDQHQQIVRRSALKRLAEVEDVANAVEFLNSIKVEKYYRNRAHR